MKNFSLISLFIVAVFSLGIQAEKVKCVTEGKSCTNPELLDLLAHVDEEMAEVDSNIKKIGSFEDYNDKYRDLKSSECGVSKSAAYNYNYNILLGKSRESGRYGYESIKASIQEIFERKKNGQCSNIGKCYTRYWGENLEIILPVYNDYEFSFAPLEWDNFEGGFSPFTSRNFELHADGYTFLRQANSTGMCLDGVGIDLEDQAYKFFGPYGKFKINKIVEE